LRSSSKFGVSGLKARSKIAIVEYTRDFSAHPVGFDRQAHRNLIQPPGGNTNTRKVPNAQAQSSPIMFQKELAAWEGLKAHPTGGFAPRTMDGVQAPQAELRS
jgi:hypothetical protein